MNAFFILVLVMASLGLAGCGAVPIAGPAVFDPGSATQVRAHQTRTFGTADRERMLRSVMATLHELGFVIDRVDGPLGLVHATKLDGYTFRVTVTVQAGEGRQTRVRASAQHLNRGEAGAGRALDNPAAYQDFFAALSRILWLDPLPPG